MGKPVPGFIADNTQRSSSEYVGQETGNTRSRNGMMIMNWQTEPAPQEIQMHGDGAHPIPYELNMDKLIEQVFWGAARAPPGRAEGLWGCIGMKNGVRPRTGITITLSLSAEGGEIGD